MLEGLPPNQATHMVRVECDGPSARRIADIVVETFDPAETAAAAFEVAFDPKSWTSGAWCVEVYFGTPPDEPLVRALIAAASNEQLAHSAVFDRVAKQDWVSASLAGLDAVREGRFVVHGSHGRNQVRAGDIGIEIEAALAFGTGHHGSTRGCLAMLNDVARRRRPIRILDVGTGTGVLAIAAARRFQRRVAAGDIDAVAVLAAAGNAKANAAGALVRPVRAPGISHPALRAHAPYDLILANILARPLRALAQGIRRLTAPGGEIVLSGLLGVDVAGVLAAYRAQGLFLVARRNIDGWATLLLRRPFNSS